MAQVGELPNVPGSFVEHLVEQRELPGRANGARVQIDLHDALAYRDRQYFRQVAALRALSLEPSSRASDA